MRIGIVHFFIIFFKAINNNFIAASSLGKLFRVIGAHVKVLEEKNKEDGWIIVEVGNTTYEGVLEIKSTKTDTFNERGRTKLLGWIDRGRTLQEKNYKGIFIGNSAVNRPKDERPLAFSGSWIKAAELSGICALKDEFEVFNSPNQSNYECLGVLFFAFFCLCLHIPS